MQRRQVFKKAKRIVIKIGTSLLTGGRVKDGGETPRTRADAFAKQLYTRDGDFAIAGRVSELAEKRGLPSAQLALAWMLAKPIITAPIIGATKMNHLEDAAAALSVQLTAEEVQFLEELYQPHPVLGFA